MDVRVRIPTPLRDLVAGAHTITVEVAADAVTVGSVLDTVAGEHPALERRVRDERGRLRTHVNVFVDADNIRDLDGLGTPLAPGAELSIVPAISGG
jgi:molybdopterin converting factor small subunit